MVWPRSSYPSSLRRLMQPISGKQHGGMTKDQVQGVEKSKLTESKENRLEYESTVAGLPVTVYYVFTEGKVAEAGYEFPVSIRSPVMPTRPSNSRLLTMKPLAEYQHVHKLLRQKYGKPAFRDRHKRKVEETMTVETQETAWHVTRNTLVHFFSETHYNGDIPTIATYHVVHYLPKGLFDERLKKEGRTKTRGPVSE